MKPPRQALRPQAACDAVSGSGCTDDAGVSAARPCGSGPPPGAEIACADETPQERFHAVREETR